MAYLFQLYCLFVKSSEIFTSQSMFSSKFNTQKHKDGVEVIIILDHLC